MSGLVLKYPGSKWKLSDWIVSHLPPHTTYLEPYFGSGAVFFRKEPSHVETINDIDRNVVNLFDVIRERPDELAAAVEMTPWSRVEFTDLLTSATEECYFERTGDELEDARRLLVRMWMSFGSRTSDRSGWRHDIQGRKGTNCPTQWSRLPDRILSAARRLRDAQIECRPALELIEAYSHSSVLIYADPPYPLSSRTNRQYKHEMTDSDHLQLLEALNRHPGPVVLSGYACPLYDTRLDEWGWARETKAAFAERGLQREEVLWLNQVAARTAGQPRLFEEA